MHPLEKEKLLYHIQHLGFVEPVPPPTASTNKKPDFICQYEYWKQRSEVDDDDHTNVTMEAEAAAVVNTESEPNQYKQESSDTTTPSNIAREHSKPSLSKKRKLLDSFVSSSSSILRDCQSKSETKRMNDILLERNRQEDQETPSIQSLIPRLECANTTGTATGGNPSLRLKISLKKKEDEFSSSPIVSPIPIEKGRMKKIDTATIQKLKFIMNHPIKKQQQLQQKHPMESSSTTASTSSDTKPCENSISSQGSTFHTNNHPISRALTTAQVQSMLAIEDTELMNKKKSQSLSKPSSSSSQIRDEDSWVRRSTRQPSRSAITSLSVQTLVEKLKMNDPDCVVLKMKKYLPDPNTPSVILDTVLDALEVNTNCQALYIQNFNEGMRDEQFLHLLKILQQPTCKIWCINVGEIYKVKTRTWATFAEGLTWTNITHMYASEHVISSAMKEMMREIIRDNRGKHTMHIDPNNLDIIVQCTHNWWNPINATVLRPYLKDHGYEYLLNDKVNQGQKGIKTDVSKI